MEYVVWWPKTITTYEERKYPPDWTMEDEP